MNVYLAGGAVRDLLLGRPIADRDYLVTDATRQEFTERFPNSREVGRTFPVFLLDGLEFSFPRDVDIEQELRSRDLTVNAMLLDENGELICHPDSLGDLHSRTLRPASRQSFLSDPLRVFRAARLWAKFPDFTPHSELVETMRLVADKGLLVDLPADRVGQETLKALQTASPGNYLRLLGRAGCLEPWFQEFKESMNIPAGPLPYHDTDVLEHTCRVMDSLAGDGMAAWMGLCHDLGKTSTPKDLLPSHHDHDQRGADMADTLARRIRLSNAHALAGRKGGAVAHDCRTLQGASARHQGGHAHGSAPFSGVPAALQTGCCGPGQGPLASGRERPQNRAGEPPGRDATQSRPRVGQKVAGASRPGSG